LTIKERRLSERYQGVSLKLELTLSHWLGLKKVKHSALVTNFALGGAAIKTQVPLRIGQRIQISILSDHHNIKQLPAEVVRCDGKEFDYHYGIRFSFIKVPQIASNNALFVLKQIENALRKNILVN
jgi:hypothetical protein